MHELAIAEAVIDGVRERIGEARVTRVVVEVGVMAMILPDALRFCFDLAAEGTTLEGAVLELHETPGRARCRACDGDVRLEQSLDRCPCGSADLATYAGHELRITACEVM